MTGPLKEAPVLTRLLGEDLPLTGPEEEAPVLTRSSGEDLPLLRPQEEAPDLTRSVEVLQTHLKVHFDLPNAAAVDLLPKTAPPAVL